MQKLLKGNHAVSYGVKLGRAQVISAYPITPQTSIVEELSEMCATGELDARFIKVESEHSAMAALLGAGSAGVRTFTATSGNGLLYMHEVLHWIAGARLPVVLANVNRAVSGGWNIWADQTDSLSQRDTGWIQLYSESNQEVLDSVIMAFKLAERVMLPVMIAYDAFFLSHTSEIVDVPEPSDVDDFLPPFDPPAKMDLDDPRMFGGLVSTDMFYEKRYKMHHDNRTVLEEYPKICAEFAERFGRSYGLVEEYRTQDADIVVAAAGTITSVARLAVERLREEGIKAGLLKIRVFRPVPADAWRRALAGARKVVVVDRNISMGSGGIFAAEAAAALYHAEQRPEIHSAVAGLGGRDVTPDDVAGIMKQALQTEGPAEAPIFWGLKE